MLKKVLLVTLSVFTFVGLTGCGDGKKLSAEEAKQEIKAAQENTAKALQNKKGITFKSNSKANASISAKNIKMGGSYSMLASDSMSMSFKASAEQSASAKINTTTFDSQLSASAKASLKYNVSMGGQTIKQDMKFDAKGDAYLINGDEKANVYLSGTANVPDEQSMAMLTTILYMIDDDIYDMIEDVDFKEKMEGKLNIAVDKDEYDVEDYVEEITTMDFDTIIKDWSIFTKKGNSLVADCSNLEAFNFNYDKDSLVTLTELGVDLKVAEFAINMNSNSEITGYDFKVTLKGDIDLAKTAKESESSSMLGGVTGKVNVDFAISSGLDITYSDSAYQITVPADLKALPEVSIDDFIPSNTKGAEKDVENAIQTAKMIAMEATAIASDNNVVCQITYNNGTCTNVDVYSQDGSTSTKNNISGFSTFDGEVDGFDGTGTIMVTYNMSEASWSYSGSITIGDILVSVSADGSISAEKNVA